MIAPHERYRAYLESLTPDTLANLSDHVTDDVRFKDPFNDVRGVDGMARVFRHMFDNVRDISFEVHRAMMEDDVCLMQWRFQGRLGCAPWAFDGTSALRFAPDGRVAEHIDYWDAAGSFYERLPFIGWLLSWVRRRLATR